MHIVGLLTLYKSNACPCRQQRGVWSILCSKSKVSNRYLGACGAKRRIFEAKILTAMTNCKENNGNIRGGHKMCCNIQKET